MTKRSSSPFLSLIVPVYNCPTIYRDIEKITTVCKKIGKPFEIICVVDGVKNSTDSTLEEVKKISEPFFRSYFLSKNRGKGFAVRFGLKKAKGKYQGFIDAGHDIEPQGILTALTLIQKTKADAVIGSKINVDSQVKYPLTRKIYSKILHSLVQSFLQLPFTDTQVGLKIFTKKMMNDLRPKLTINRWAFDLELLTLAYRNGYTNIKELPVKITYNYATNINAKDLALFLIEFTVITYKLRFINDYQ